MKKKLPLLLVLLLLLTMTACSLSFLNRYDSSEPPEEPAPPSAEVQPQEPDVPAEPDTPQEPGEPGEPGEAEEPLLPDPDKSGEEEDAAAPEITASHKDVTLKSEGETFTLSARDVPGTYACTFTSADPAVAEADEKTGAVTAVAPGVTKITMHVEYEGGQLDFECIVRCRWEEESKQPDQPESGTSPSQRPALSSFFSTLQSKYDALDAMMVIEGELLDNYYPGLSGIAAVEEVLVQETMMSMSNVAVGLVKLSGDATIDDVAAVQQVFQARIKTQAEGGAWYPMSCETWEQGVTTSTNNVVGMFVYPDSAQDLADLFTETFSA